MADRSSYSRIDCSSSTPSVQPTIIITSLLASWQRWKIIDFQILFIALNWRFFYFLILAEQRQHSLHKMVFVVLSGKKKIVLPLKIVQIFLSVKIKSRRWKQKTIRNITPPRHYFKLGNVRKDRGFVVTYWKHYEVRALPSSVTKSRRDA